MKKQCETSEEECMRLKEENSVLRERLVKLQHKIKYVRNLTSSSSTSLDDLEQLASSEEQQQCTENKNYGIVVMRECSCNSAEVSETPYPPNLKNDIVIEDQNSIQIKQDDISTLISSFEVVQEKDVISNDNSNFELKLDIQCNSDNLENKKFLNKNNQFPIQVIIIIIIKLKIEN